jgi:hypothetical protein
MNNTARDGLCHSQDLKPVEMPSLAFGKRDELGEMLIKCRESGRVRRDPGAARGAWMLGIKDGIQMHRMVDG